MVSRKIAWSTMIVALALWGCGDELPPGETFPERDFVCADGESPPCATTEPVNTDAQRTHEPGMELDNETRTFVMNALLIPDGAGGLAPGFNLDGIDSGGIDSGDGSSGTCEENQPDFISPADPGHIGVDNALLNVLTFAEPLLGGTDLNETVLEQIASGDLLLLITVSGIDSLRYDPEVSMQLALGELPDGAETELDGSGKLAAGQSFDIKMTLGPMVQGDIYDGRLRATVPNITIPIAASDFSLDLSISNPQVRFDISESGLANGVIGGVITIDDLIEAIAQIPAAADFCGDEECTTVRGLAEEWADIDPLPSDPEICTALSVGLGFEATTASTN